MPNLLSLKPKIISHHLPSLRLYMAAIVTRVNNAREFAGRGELHMLLALLERQN